MGILLHPFSGEKAKETGKVDYVNRNVYTGRKSLHKGLWTTLWRMWKTYGFQQLFRRFGNNCAVHNWMHKLRCGGASAALCSRRSRIKFQEKLPKLEMPRQNCP
ncbi:MAG: hypothetical protein IJO31_04140 [Oscillospiraceae bacterium]|nr:hypothetical protein [Oscillospiraceae bacterium]